MPCGGDPPTAPNVCLELPCLRTVTKAGLSNLGCPAGLFSTAARMQHGAPDSGSSLRGCPALTRACIEPGPGIDAALLTWAESSSVSHITCHLVQKCGNGTPAGQNPRLVALVPPAAGAAVWEWRALHSAQFLLASEPGGCPSGCGTHGWA